jgi:putative membrane protein insertion efficiency factor
MSCVHDQCTHDIDVPRSRFQSGLLRAIHWYQVAREGRPSPCRFWPSCSEYALEAISVHGSGRGTWLAIRRLSRCRPFGPSGVDPVPAPKGHA